MDEQKLLNTFGFNVKIYRQKMQMSQDDLVDVTEFSKAYISNVEHGKHNISLVNAIKFAQVFGKTVDEMLKEID